MKQLILDRVRRFWLLWLALAAIHFIVGSLIVQSYEIRWSSFWFFLVLGPSTFLTDLPKGYSRLALTLPFTTRQMGRMLWLSTVGLCWLVAIPASLCGVFFFSEGAIRLDLWTIYIVVCLLIYGSLFWFNTGAPPPQAITARQRIWRWVYGLLFWAVLALSYFLLKDFLTNPIKTIGFTLLGGTMTLLGWRRAEGLVVDHGERRSTAAFVPAKKSQHQTPSGFGGMAFFISTQFVRTTLTLLAVLSVLVVVNLLFQLKSGHGFSLKETNSFIHQTQFWTFFYLIQGPFAAVLHLRFLRSLPLASKQLAAGLLALAIVPWCGSACVYSGLTALALGATHGLVTIEAYMLGIAPVCVLTVAAIWHNEKRFLRIFGLVLAFIATAAPAFYQAIEGNLSSGNHGYSLGFIILYPTITVWLSTLAIGRLLERNTMTYRIRTDEMPSAWGGKQ